MSLVRAREWHGVFTMLAKKTIKNQITLPKAVMAVSPAWNISM